MLKYEQRFWRLDHLLISIERGEIAMPAFQRDFSWDTSNVRALLATVVMGWPAGALLAVEGHEHVGHIKRFSEGPRPSSGVALVLLDGQQRLTALYHAFGDVGLHVYAIRRSALGARSIDDVEAGIEAIPRNKWNGQQSQRLRGPDPLIPFSALRSDHAFFSFLANTGDVDQLELSVPKENSRDSLVDAYNVYSRRAGNFAFPVILIDTPTDSGDLSRIFERVNRTGLALGPFDLVVARAFDEEFNLRDRWEDARLDYPQLFRYLGGDGMPVLQVIAMEARGDVRRSAVLSLSAQEIREHWDTVMSAMADAIDVLRTTCGVADPSWLPYRSLVVSLTWAGLVADVSGHETLIRRWFFSRSFGLAFEAASNTRVVRDAGELRKALSGGGLPEDKVDWGLVLRATRKSHGAIWGAFLCALVCNEAVVLSDDGSKIESLKRFGMGPSGVFSESLVPKRSANDQRRPDLLVLTQVLCDRPWARRLTRSGAEALNQPRLWVNLPHQALASQFIPPDYDIHSTAENPHLLALSRLDLLREFLQLDRCS